MRRPIAAVALWLLAGQISLAALPVVARASHDSFPTAILAESITAPAELPIISLTVQETITVVDSPVIIPPLTLTVEETIAVTDLVQPLPAVSLTISESILVTDSPGLFPPLSLLVAEVIGVADSTGALPATLLALGESIAVTDSVSLLAVSIPFSGDVNGDGSVNAADIGLLIASFNRRSGDPGYNVLADLNGDGIVDIFDLAVAGLNYGRIR